VQNKGNEVLENCKVMTLPRTLVNIGSKFFNFHKYHFPYDIRRNGWFLDTNNPNLTIYCYVG
jgi:hypothetical protein